MSRPRTSLYRFQSPIQIQIPPIPIPFGAATAAGRSRPATTSPRAAAHRTKTASASASASDYLASDLNSLHRRADGEEMHGSARLKQHSLAGDDDQRRRHPMRPVTRASPLPGPTASGVSSPSRRPRMLATATAASSSLSTSCATGRWRSLPWR